MPNKGYRSSTEEPTGLVKPNTGDALVDGSSPKSLLPKCLTRDTHTSTISLVVAWLSNAIIGTRPVMQRTA